LDDQRNDGENSCNPGDGMDQRVQTLMFIIIIIIIIMTSTKFNESRSAFIFKVTRG
jgi:hypothetical protein